ncbi:MAG: hypothetical protein AAGG75_28600 [Bacteroidota bacterium]
MKLNKLYKKECSKHRKARRRRKHPLLQASQSPKIISLDQLYEEVKFQQNLNKILYAKVLKRSKKIQPQQSLNLSEGARQFF